MAWVDTGDNLGIEKRGPENRWDESFAALVRNVRTRAVIAHNRLASPGLKIDPSLSHPYLATFKDLPVAFCHNGGIRNLMDEAKAQNVTDSQLFFRELLDSVDMLDHRSLGSALKRFADEWSYTSLSAILLTPRSLHLFRCYDATDSRRDDFEKYYTLWRREHNDGIIIASEAVDQAGGWTLLPNRTLLTIDLTVDALSQVSSQL